MQVVAGECKGCGYSLDETTDPETVRSWEAEAVVCHACEARERQMDIAAEESRKGGFRAFGEKWYVVWKGR